MLPEAYMADGTRVVKDYDKLPKIGSEDFKQLVDDFLESFQDTIYGDQSVLERKIFM